jgi:small nuclear ribonucleoprotein (snRNP)-like protein
VLREPGVPTGTKYFGVLRSFDQFCEWAVQAWCQQTSLTTSEHVSTANLVLQDCVEREYVGQEYAEKQRGLFIVRGENVVFISQLVCGRTRLATRLL